MPGINYSEQRLRSSDLTYGSGPYKEPAGTPTTILTIKDSELQGMIRVRKIRSSSDKEFVPQATNASAYLIMRKATKHYRWGDAQSCLAQFTNEAWGYSPNNNALDYQASGSTTDGKFSVFCSFGIKHPKLPSIQNAQSYHGDELDRLNSHPDVSMVEHAPSDEFHPSIDQIDAVISSLKIRE